MRPFPAVKALVSAAALLALGAGAASAQTVTTQSGNPNNMAAMAQALTGGANAGGSNAYTGSAYGQNPSANPYNQAPGIIPGLLPPGMMPQQEEPEMTAAELNDLLKNPDSPQYKADRLADKAKREGDVVNFARSNVKEDDETVITDISTPPEMESLQDIHAAHGTRYNVTDEEVNEELMGLDIRRDAQKESALSYGARGGLAKRNYQISERLNDYEGTLDKVFNFRALLVKAPSGLLIEPPIVRESLDNIMINADGQEAAVADSVFDINKQAKIVSAPRDWRQYLIADYEAEIMPPPRILWPKDDKEQAEWNGWVKQGWQAGYEQGQDTFETMLNQLVSDYNGMVRYRLLLAQGMISQPYALHEDRGVTGDKTIMRVGDRALRLTGPSQFLTGSDLWKPADR